MNTVIEEKITYINSLIENTNDVNYLRDIRDNLYQLAHLAQDKINKENIKKTNLDLAGKYIKYDGVYAHIKEGDDSIIRMYIGFSVSFDLAIFTEDGKVTQIEVNNPNSGDSFTDISQITIIEKEEFDNVMKMAKETISKL